MQDSAHPLPSSSFFRLRRVTLLTGRLLNITQTALGGGEVALRVLSQALRFDGPTGTQMRLTLPAIYKALDIAPLQLASSNLGAVECDTQLCDAIGGSRFALECVHIVTGRDALDIPPADVRLLWSRVWAWSEFFATHEPVSESHGRAGDTAVLVLSVSRHFLERTEVTRFAYTPRDVHRVVGHAWRLILNRRNFSNEQCRRQLGIHASAFLLPDPRFAAHTTDAEVELQMNEIIHGLGASLDIARITIAQLRCAFPLKTSPADADAVTVFRGGILLVPCALVICGKVFETDLHRNGLVRRLATAFHALTHCSDAEQRTVGFSRALEMCCSNLRLALTAYVPQVYRSYITSYRRIVRGGFLSSLRTFWAHASRYYAVGDELRVARQLVTPWLVYRGVLLTIRRHSESLLNEVSAAGFETGRSERTWTALLELIKARLRLVDEYDEHVYEHVLRECDYPECDQQRHPTELQMCGDCKRVYYCSAQCARRHWTATHKKQCAVLTRQPVEWHSNDFRPLSLIEEGFVRCVLIAEHASRKHDLAFDLYLFLVRDRASRGAPCLTFDFLAGPVSMAVRAMSDFAISDGLSWDHRERALKGDPVYVLFLEGSSHRAFVTMPCLMDPVRRIWHDVWNLALDTDDAEALADVECQVVMRQVIEDLIRNAEEATSV